jgi:hypothetical protein
MNVEGVLSDFERGGTNSIRAPRRHILHCVSNMNSDGSSGTNASIMPLALLHRLGSSSGYRKLAKCFVHEKLCKKVQFLQLGNDELMKNDSDSFMNVWSMTVLPAIKNKINVVYEECICGHRQ